MTSLIHNTSTGLPPIPSILDRGVGSWDPSGSWQCEATLDQEVL